MPTTLRYLRSLFPLAVVAVVGCSSPNAGKAEASEGRGTGGAVATAVTGRGNSATAVAEAATVVVYKNPTCQCCEKWADHLRAHGFRVQLHTAEDLDRVKKAAGVPEQLATCHTARVDGYVIEGHVPADVVERLLQERPAIAGIAVPGMPRGVPGMDGPIKDRYDVIAFAHDGTSSVYASR